MKFELGQKVKIKDSGTISEIITNFENGQKSKTYAIISDIDNERILLSENKIEKIKFDKCITKNVIRNILKFKTKIFKKIEKIKYYIIYSNCYSEMEYYGISSFNCCEGSIEIFCSECPYFYKNKQIEHQK